MLSLLLLTVLLSTASSQTEPENGETYIRWGRSTCPENGAELVYEGRAGGSFFNHKGAAANYLCLAKDPSWGKYNDSDSLESSALLYGAEYQTHDTLGTNVYHQDVPCAVCKIKRIPVMMIPGKNTCYDGWTLEYTGYLTAGRYAPHPAASEYVCLDGNPDTVPNGETTRHGVLFYFIEGKCDGTLKCPPYVHGREITCAVCSLDDSVNTGSQVSGHGDTYVRWGRKTCPENGSELVYEGFAGGSNAGHTGAAYNYLCLPNDPEWPEMGLYDDTVGNVPAYLYGAEYRTQNRLQSSGITNHEVPCAVCRSSQPTLMVPGRTNCHEGWTLEYTGYLTAGQYNQAATSEYVCLDGDPETLGDDTDVNDGKTFSFVEGRCGSLQCPPYVQGREITCAVCSAKPREEKLHCSCTLGDDKYMYTGIMESKSSEGPTYVRWGGTTCPENGTELVYEGWVGGSNSGHTGAAANYLCLPKDPSWGLYDDAEEEGAFLYGAEYKTQQRLETDVQNQDVPCAVCRKVKRTPTLMIPGRNHCYDGWTLEYKGYLAAGLYTQDADSTYICLDENLETVAGGDSEMPGTNFYFTEGRCGSLRCPPYVQGRELTCAVCSYTPQ